MWSVNCSGGSRRHKLFQLVVDVFYNGVSLRLNIDTLSKLSIDPRVKPEDDGA